MVFKICEGISCSLFSVKELDVIAHKFPYSFFAILYPHITSEPGGWGGN